MEKQGAKGLSYAMLIGLSLFIYPGVGHFTLRKFRTGAVIAIAFTLASVAMLYDGWLMIAPYIASFTGLKFLAAGEPAPWRFFFWVCLSFGAWMGSAVHCCLLARGNNRAEEKSSES